MSYQKMVFVVVVSMISYSACYRLSYILARRKRTNQEAAELYRHNEKPEEANQ